MAELTNTACIHQLDYLFTKAEAMYEDIFIINELAPFDLALVKNKWLNDPINPLLRISTQLVQTYRGSDLKKEVDDNLINNNTGYFKYVANIVGKRIAFLKKFFPETIAIYFNQPDRRIELLKKLYNGGDLSKNEFITAVQLDFIEKCELLEITYQKYYPDYVLQLTAAMCPAEIDGMFEPILLKYKERNSQVIKELYSFLYNNYIDEEYDTFAAHFVRQNTDLPRIIWKGNLMLLCMVFKGADLNDSHLTHVTNIRVSNLDLKKMINQHFCDVNGKEFSIGTINTYFGRLTKRGNINGAEPFIKPLKKINMLL